MPLIPLCAAVTGAAAAVLGGLVGLILGLRAYPPTAWFVVLEVGIPAGIFGAILGALAAVFVQRVNHH